MAAEKITVHVRLTPAAFRRFCRFDNFKRQHRWFVPIMTGMIMITISMALLFFGNAASETMPGILMGLGIAFPLICFGIYKVQIEAQIAKQKLRSVPEIYTLVLQPSGVRITGMGAGPGRSAEVSWPDFWAAFRCKDAIYLYRTPARALILPDGCADVPEEQIWNYLIKQMGEQRCIRSRII